MFYRTALLLTVIWMATSCTSKKLTIKSLFPHTQVFNNLDRQGRERNEQSVFKHFFVENWNPRDNSKARQLRNFALKQRDTDYSKYYQYEMYFYNKTNVLNENFDSTVNDDIAWHQKDLAATARWYQGGRMFFKMYENGNCVNCGDSIRIE